MKLLHRTLTLRALLFALCAVLASAGFAAPKNIILMIGDGMGPDSVYAAGAYKYGNDFHLYGGKQRLTLETLKDHLYVTTYSADGNGYDFGWQGGDRTYVKTKATDSAAAATAMSTGVKTYDAAICVDTKKQPLTTIVEIAKGRGMKTGVITSVPFSHATPAGFASHNESRNNYTALAHDMLFNVRPDVVMGAGHPDGAAAGKEYEYINKEDYQQIASGQTPYFFIQDRAEFRHLITNPRCGKVFGLFRNHNCLKYCNADRAAADPTLPTLAEMAEGTLETLRNDNGFFLMIEGGAIDWCNHADDLNGSIGETLAFDDTVSMVLHWIARNGGWKDNLLIITADHETGYLNSVQLTGKGRLPSVKWGNDGKGWTSHTNRLVDVYFQGANDTLLFSRSQPAKDFERGAVKYIDDTDIFKAMDAALRLHGSHPPVPECIPTG